MLARLITNQYHLENQFRKMHKQICQQRGDTLQNRNTTAHSKDGPTFLVKEVSIHCTHQRRIQKRFAIIHLMQLDLPWVIAPYIVNQKGVRKLR